MKKLDYDSVWRMSGELMINSQFEKSNGCCIEYIRSYLTRVRKKSKRRLSGNFSRNYRLILLHAPIQDHEPGIFLRKIHKHKRFMNLDRGA
jgi:hypothetical protein